jgi:hypothetical protein
MYNSFFQYAIPRGSDRKVCVKRDGTLPLLSMGKMLSELSA